MIKREITSNSMVALEQICAFSLPYFSFLKKLNAHNYLTRKKYIACEHSLSNETERLKC